MPRLWSASVHHLPLPSPPGRLSYGRTSDRTSPACAARATASAPIPPHPCSRQQRHQIGNTIKAGGSTGHSAGLARLCKLMQLQTHWSSFFIMMTSFQPANAVRFAAPSRRAIIASILASLPSRPRTALVEVAAAAAAAACCCSSSAPCTPAHRCKQRRCTAVVTCVCVSPLFRFRARQMAADNACSRI